MIREDEWESARQDVGRRQTGNKVIGMRDHLFIRLRFEILAFHLQTVWAFKYAPLRPNERHFCA